MKRSWSDTAGWLAAAAAGTCFFLPVSPTGLILVPGILSLVLGLASLLSVRLRQGSSTLPGAVAVVLALGAFLIPLLAVLSSGGTGIAVLLLPFLACALLVGIHTYFGIHVLTRGIIFVDLSLAQVASLGAVLAFAMGVSLGTREAYLSSLAFALCGALIFALSRSKKGRVPQEAVIGIVYAVASAAAMLLVDRNPEGMELIKNALTGRMLWVNADSIVTTSRIYGAVALLHIVFSGRFSMITRDHEAAARHGLNVTFWDVLFYASFGIVITKSVEISGVLLVFSFLVIPAVISSLFLERPGVRLAVGWLLGTAASIAGLLLSFGLDLSAGPTIVTVLTLFLLLAGLTYHIARSQSPVRALLRITAGLAAVIVTLYGFYYASPLRRGESGTEGRGHDHDLHDEMELHRTGELDETGHPKGSHARHLLDHYLDDPEASDALAYLKNHIDNLIELLHDESAEVRERAASVIPLVGRGVMVEHALELAFAKEPDAWVRFEIASSMFELNRVKGGRALLSLMADEEMPVFLHSRAAAMLADLLDTDHGYRPGASPEENRESLDSLSDDLSAYRP